MPAWTSGDDFPPGLVGNVVFGGNDGPVRAGLCLYPLEVVDLIPLIGRVGRSLRRVDQVGLDSRISFSYAEEARRKTYMELRQRGKANSLAVFNDGSACTV